MIRIWAKTVKNDKITRSYIYESIDNFNEDKFYLHIQKMCHEIDIPTPAILKAHVTNYMDFNNATFLPRDFVESIDFDKFIIENATISKWYFLLFYKIKSHSLFLKFYQLCCLDVSWFVQKHLFQKNQLLLKQFLLHQ